MDHPVIHPTNLPAPRVPRSSSTVPPPQAVPIVEPNGTVKSSWIPAKSGLHLIAGGLGGMCGGMVTAPFDTVKTRLQSSMFQKASSATPYTTVVSARPGGLLWNFVETGHLLREIQKLEGVPALFKGLGPTLVGVIPARSINFFTYGNGKQVIANKFNDGVETAAVHLSAAAFAGIATSTFTNPIWVVKTRMQLSAGQSKPFSSSWECIRTILHENGIRGLYKGLSASYLGVSEGIIQWTLYEQLRRVAKRVEGGPLEWVGMSGAAGGAKMIASLITYPHEVVRTRLRQPNVNGVLKYRSLVQTFRLVVAEEGTRALYCGLSAHLLRVIPNAVVMYSIYELVIGWGSKKQLDPTHE